MEILQQDCACALVLLLKVGCPLAAYAGAGRDVATRWRMAYRTPGTIAHSHFRCLFLFCFQPSACFPGLNADLNGQLTSEQPSQPIRKIVDRRDAARGLYFLMITWMFIIRIA